MSISATEVQASDVTIYKVVAPLEGSLLSWNEAQQSTYHNAFASTQFEDWRALYTQFQREHVLGTLPYKWDKGYTDATLVSATFAHLNIVVLEGDVMYDVGVSGQEKAVAIKRLLCLDETSSLMQMLGRQGKAALVKETQEEWELIIPHRLLPELSFTECRVAEFKRHALLPITHAWRLSESDTWELWQDEVEPDSIPDTDMSWLELAEKG
mmetsp:Transcript_65037/g.121153  ORF Transcript_65037/g.121153 Transcript_65037/m.121153 type:complete len:211 (+) Transcript_65037:77-709(+)